jgi:hypothetical protein
MSKALKERLMRVAVATGLLAIFVSGYIQYGIPYLQEKNLEKTDTTRITGLIQLNQNIKEILNTNPGTTLGLANTVYISIPSADNCSDLDLPSLPTNWNYHCVSSAELQETNGNGWLPINFDTASSSSYILPIDPVNTAADGNYFSFITATSASGTPEYVLVSNLETKKDISSLSETDSSDPTHYELGNDLSLWNQAQSIKAYWPFTDNGNIAYDYSGAGNNLILPKNIVYTDAGCVLQKCILNTSNFPIVINFNTPYQISAHSVVSYGFWFKIPSVPATNQQIFNPGTNRLDVNIEGESGALFIWFTNTTTEEQVYKSIDSGYIGNGWHQIFVVKSLNSVSVYIDGQAVEEITTTSNTQLDLPQGIITLLPGEAMNRLVIYGRALSPNEVQDSFEVQK